MGATIVLLLEVVPVVAEKTKRKRNEKRKKIFAVNSDLGTVNSGEKTAGYGM